jgi:hypothetical protein
LRPSETLIALQSDWTNDAFSRRTLRTNLSFGAHLPGRAGRARGARWSGLARVPLCPPLSRSPRRPWIALRPLLAIAQCCKP